MRHVVAAAVGEYTKLGRRIPAGAFQYRWTRTAGVNIGRSPDARRPGAMVGSNGRAEQPRRPSVGARLDGAVDTREPFGGPDDDTVRAPG